MIIFLLLMLVVRLYLSCYIIEYAFDLDNFVKHECMPR